MPKRVAKRKDSDEESEEIEDVMAWGSKKDNYYKDSQNQYSSLEEEQQEAQKIYQSQLEQLQDHQLYQIPQQESEPELSEEDEGKGNEQGLSRAYLTKQIRAMTKLGLSISEQSDSRTKNLLQTYIQAYLMSLIALRQLQIPYIQFHPIVNKTLELKEEIKKLNHLLEAQSNTKEQEGDDEQVEGEDLEYSAEQEGDYDNEDQQEGDVNNYEGDIEQGLKIYQETKTKQDQQKKQKKEEKKKERVAKKRPAFLEVKGNEGRLASQKILKNKGLIKKRKKADRNSRVKLRRKFDKATSKRRAYGHVIRQNPGRDYQGERNIKYGRIASTKLK